MAKNRRILKKFVRELDEFKVAYYFKQWYLGSPHWFQKLLTFIYMENLVKLTDMPENEIIVYIQFRILNNIALF